MITLRYKIENVDLFKLVEGDLYANSIDGGFIINEDRIKALDGKYFSPIRPNIISKKEDNILLVFDKDSGVIKSYELPLAENYILESDRTFYLTIRDFNDVLLKKYSNQKIEWTINNSKRHSIYFDNMLSIYQHYKSGFFEVIDLDKGEIIWTWDITEKHAYTTVGRHKKGHLNDRVILWQDRFIMPVGGNEDGWPLYALHKDTGEVIWHITRSLGHNLSIMDDRLISASDNRIQEYDLETGALLRDESFTTITDKYGHYMKSGLKCRTEMILDNRLFYYGSKSYDIVILDFNTLEILDEYHLEKTSPESWQLGDMKVSDGKIYIKEYMKQGGTVHVLEY